MASSSTQHDLGKLILRVALGALILLHGIAKLRGGMADIEHMVVARGLPGFIAYGVLIGEVLAPVLLIMGFHARAAAATIAVNMLFAFALTHMGQFGQFNPNGGWALELQGIFLFGAVALALLGPGRYAVNER